MKEEEDFCFFAIGFEEVQYVCVWGGAVLCLFGCRWRYSGSPWSSGGVADLTTGKMVGHLCYFLICFHYFHYLSNCFMPS